MVRKIILFFTLLSAVLYAASGFAQDASQSALQAAVQSNPKNDLLRYNLAVSYVKQRQYDQAVPELQKAIELNPSNKDAKGLLESCLGMVSVSKNDFRSAADHFQNALKINPNDSDAANLFNQCQAQVSVDAGDYPQAVTYLSRVLKADPGNMSACQSLGGAYYQMKDYRHAVEYFEKTVKSRPDAKTHLALGNAYYNLGDFNNAIVNFKKSIDLESSKDPKDRDSESLSETYYNLAVAYNDNALYDDAAQAFGEAFKLNPKDSNAALGQSQAIEAAVTAHMEKGNGFLLNGQYSDAIAEWQKVLGYQPDDKQAADLVADAKSKLGVEVEKHLRAGKSYSQKGRQAQALAEWNAALEMDPGNETALAAIKRADVKNSVQVTALLKEGDELYQAKDYPGALEKYKAAARISPSSSSVKAKLKKLRRNQKNDFDDFYSRGKSDLKKGNLKAALVALESACRIDPNNDQARADLFFARKEATTQKNSLLDEGTRLFESGDKSQAQKKFQAVLALDPNNDKANEYIQKMTGQQSQAKVDLDKSKALYYEGVNLYINGKIREAIAKWKECKQADPDNVSAQDSIDKANAKLQSIEKLSQ